MFTIFEIRIHYGAGFRIYFGIRKQTIIVITNGGTKKTQKKDIERAKKLWKEYIDGNW